MHPDEIAAVRLLHDTIWDWLRGGNASPCVESQISFVRIWAVLSSSGSILMDRVEELYDTEAIRSINFSVVYPVGRPAKPYQQWLPPIRKSSDVESVHGDLERLRSQLTPGAFVSASSLADRAALAFRRRGDARRELLSRRAVEVLGKTEADKWLAQMVFTRTALESIEEDRDFQRNLAALKKAEHQGGRERKSRSRKIRAWRSESSRDGPD